MIDRIDEIVPAKSATALKSVTLAEDYFLIRPGAMPEVLKRAPQAFDPAGLAVARHEAISEDGTRIPYVQVGPPGETGAAPVHLSGYGGFGVSQLPYYNSAVGKLWLERGTGPKGHWSPPTRERYERIVRHYIDASANPDERPLGSYRLRVTGAGAPPTMELRTLSGPLQMQGKGTMEGSRIRFNGVAGAEPAMRPALNGLLGVLGMRSGDKVLLAIDT